MRRALQLAARGRGFTAPNPMVGAVIVNGDRVIGEGFHRRCGGPHAEVNAVRSVCDADRALLTESTMYVTLEPCSHYGKTPPCAKLIIETGIPRVVVGCMDPNERVSGRGIAMLREAGVEVVTGVLEDECRALNKVFITAHTLQRPYITLKWAQSSDGYMGMSGTGGSPAPVGFSTPLSTLPVHKLRAEHQAILVGAGTVLSDNPRLDVRCLAGANPLKVVVDRRGRVGADAQVFSGGNVLYVSSVNREDLPADVRVVQCAPDASVRDVVDTLWRCGITSVLVEGGASVLGAFISSGLWDEARVEVAQSVTLGEKGYGKVDIPAGEVSAATIDGNVVINVKNPRSVLK